MIAKALLTREQVIEVAKLYNSKAATAQELVKTYGLKGTSNVVAWGKRLKEKGEAAFPETGYIKHKYRTPEQAASLVAQVEARDRKKETQSEACARLGIPLKNYARWKKRIVTGKTRTGSSVQKSFEIKPTKAFAAKPNELETADHIRTMQAFLDGKEIESRPRGTVNTWVRDIRPSWDFESKEFRVKPREPRIIYVRIPKNSGRAYAVKPTDPKGIKFVEAM